MTRKINNKIAKQLRKANKWFGRLHKKPVQMVTLAVMPYEEHNASDVRHNMCCDGCAAEALIATAYGLARQQGREAELEEMIAKEQRNGLKQDQLH